MHKLNLGTLSSIKLNPDLLRKLHVTVDYDSDKTKEYWPMDNDQSPNFELILVSKPKKAMETQKRKIKSKPSKGSFSFSVHGVKKCKRRTYLSCKVDGCKTKFNSVKAWNAHYHRLHQGNLLKCRLCSKEFKTLSFMRDHMYVHSDKAFKCNLCHMVFALKSSYQIHR